METDEDGGTNVPGEINVRYAVYLVVSGSEPKRGSVGSAKYNDLLGGGPDATIGNGVSDLL